VHHVGIFSMVTYFYFKTKNIAVHFAVNNSIITPTSNLSYV